MDGGDRESLAMKELVQRVGTTLRFHEDQGPRGLGKSHYEHEFENGNFGASIRLFTPILFSLWTIKNSIGHVWNVLLEFHAEYISNYRIISRTIPQILWGWSNNDKKESK